MSKRQISYVMAGQALIASIIRTGNGRHRPVRWVTYWSPLAERMGATPCTQGYPSKREAEAVAMLWADLNMDQQPYVQRAR